jgi:hypothetical protein
MRALYIAALLTLLGVACTTPHGTITARPDPNVSSSGTLGSVKATDGVLPLNETPVAADTTHTRH